MENKYHFVYSCTKMDIHIYMNICTALLEEAAIGSKVKAGSPRKDCCIEKQHWHLGREDSPKCEAIEL